MIGKIGDGVALLGFPHATVSTSGFKYDMQNRALAFEQFASISNTLVKEEAIVQIAGGILCIQEIFL
jgi:thiamine pyrophosphokinase